MAVSSTHKNYNKYSNQIQTVRDALSGYETLLSKRETYFKKLTSEDSNDYLANIQRVGYDNYISKQLDDLTGTLISKEPIIKIPTKLQPFLNDMDGSGKTHIDFIQDLSYELFVAGRVGVLIGYFAASENLVINKSEFNKDARPIAQIYPTESIINWRYENNKLQMVVLSEVVEVWISEFETKDIQQYTVIYLEDNICKRKVIRQDDKGVDYVVNGSEMVATINGKTIDFIPFFSANTNTLDINPEKSPFYDSAVVNIALHRLKIDLYRGLYYIGIPTPYGSGIDSYEVEDDNSFVLGSSKVKFFSKENAKLQYLEFNGDGLGAIEREIESCKTVIANLGAEFLKNDTNKAESTETTMIKNRSNLASLNNVADVISRLMVKIFQTFALYYGNSEEVEYKIDTDFNIDKVDANLLKQLGSELEMGHITDLDYYYKLREWELTQYETFEEWNDARSENKIPLDFSNVSTTPSPTNKKEDLSSSLLDSVRKLISTKKAD